MMKNFNVFDFTIHLWVRLQIVSLPFIIIIAFYPPHIESIFYAALYEIVYSIFSLIPSASYGVILFCLLEVFPENFPFKLRIAGRFNILCYAFLVIVITETYLALILPAIFALISEVLIYWTIKKHFKEPENIAPGVESLIEEIGKNKYLV